MSKALKYVNLVFARHRGNPKIYVFQAELGQEVLETDHLIADTVNGTVDDLIAASRSVIINEKDARVIVRNFGAVWPLREILGKTSVQKEVVEKTVVTPFAGHEKEIELYSQSLCEELPF